jgi:hypothetical protein
MLKWIGILFVSAIIYMIATGNMGGAKKATQNYSDVIHRKG